MARNGGAAKLRSRGITALAWASLAIAVAGGALAAGTWIGEAIGTLVGLFPWPWFPPVLVLAGTVAVAIDLLIDLVPNQVAIGCALLIPSVAAAAPGKLGASITDMARSLLGVIDDSLVDWVGTDSSVGLTLACVVGAILMSRRVVKKSGSRT